jgi:hypothetical protein
MMKKHPEARLKTGCLRMLFRGLGLRSVRLLEAPGQYSVGNLTR